MTISNMHCAVAKPCIKGDRSQNCLSNYFKMKFHVVVLLVCLAVVSLCQSGQGSPAPSMTPGMAENSSDEEGFRNGFQPQRQNPNFCDSTLDNRNEQGQAFANQKRAFVVQDDANEQSGEE